MERGLNALLRLPGPMRDPVRHPNEARPPGAVAGKLKPRRPSRRPTRARFADELDRAANITNMQSYVKVRKLTEHQVKLLRIFGEQTVSFRLTAVGDSVFLFAQAVPFFPTCTVLFRSEPSESGSESAPKSLLVLHERASLL